jgi:hypothetical protein
MGITGFQIFSRDTDSNSGQKTRKRFLRFGRRSSSPNRIRDLLTKGNLQMQPNHSDAASMDGISTLGSVDDSLEPSVKACSPRNRINSRDISRTYSGLYGQGDDLLPLEVQRIASPPSVLMFLFMYITLILFVLLVVILLLHVTVGDAVEESQLGRASLTLTHAIHLTVTVVHVHWLKGSVFDPQGEMNALTIWEQLEARGSDAYAIRQVLLIVPTVLCYAACHFSHYEPLAVLANFIMLAIALLAKAPYMNGVRILGINRTVGIDDDVSEEGANKTDKKDN